MKFKNLFKDITAGADSERVVGIDIGSSSIKVVEVQEKDSVLNLTTYGELQLGPYANKDIGESVVLDAKSEQQALIDVIRESGVKAKQAVFAMPLSSSFVTMINFVADSDEDLSARIRVEARKYIPVPISEVTLDWAEVDYTENSNDKKIRNVLVAAIQNQALNRFKVLMQFVNLKDTPTEIECFSSIRSAYSEKKKNIAVIDIGAVSTKLYIAHNGLLRRMHRVRAGGTIATKRIAGSLNITFAEAEEKKRATTKDDVDFREIESLHHSAYDRTWQEFGQVIKEYETRHNISLDAIYLTGGGSIFPNTDKMIQSILNRDVVPVHIFNKLAYPAFMEDMMTELDPTFHVALGAVLRMFE
ncbi:MAG: pilus assembly protein PilM [Candidatus Paceibacterota bacterium]